MISSNEADEAALERSYSVAPAVDVATAEELLRKHRHSPVGISASITLRYSLLSREANIYRSILTGDVK